MKRRTHSKTLRQLAAALDVAPDQLAYFRECHPNPTVDVVLNLADRPPVDAETRELASEWLTDDSPSGDGTASADSPGQTHGVTFQRGGELNE